MATFAVWTIISWIIVIIAVVILLFGGSALIWKGAKLGLSLFGYNFTEEQIDYTVINENAISTFNALIRSINKCQLGKDNNCACEASFTGFFKTHKLENDGNELKLINIKDGNEITMKKEKVQGLNCYLDRKTKKTLNKLEILFDKDLPYIPISGSDAKFDKNLKLYKDNNLCWLTSKADLTNVKTCS